MKNIQFQIIILILTCIIPSRGITQNDLNYEIQYEIKRVYPSLTVTKEKLNNAHTLTDLNGRYQSSWVKEYKSVEILTTHNGRVIKTVGKDDILSKEQKDIMEKADVGSEISINVRYIPDNTLSYNDVKEQKFSFSIDPDIEATFTGGMQHLNQYLKEKGIDKITNKTIQKNNLAAVKFMISEEGKVVDVQVFSTTKDKKTDNLLLEAICNMPNWKPAEHSNGLKVEQEFVLTIGDMESCMINLLNVRNEY